MTTSPDAAYHVLGLTAGASDAELRHAYRRLVQLHHPDHNGGSPESARRFAEIQSAYTQILAVRHERMTGGVRSDGASGAATEGAGDLDARIAAMERELQEARETAAAAREAAIRAAREGSAGAGEGSAGAGESRAESGSRRPTPEELGYVTTDDSFSAILDDASEELGRRWSRSKGRSLAERLSDLFDDGK